MLHLKPGYDDGQSGCGCTVNVIHYVGTMVCIHELDGVRVDGLQRLRHSEFGALVHGQPADALQQRLKSAQRAGVAFDHHIQLVSVVLALEQRLFVPGPHVTRCMRRDGMGAHWFFRKCLKL